MQVDLCDINVQSEGQPITAPTSNARRNQSICNSGRFAKVIYFALQMPTNIVSLLKAFR